MKQSHRYVSVFILCLTCALLVFGIGVVFKIQGISWIESAFSPLQKMVLNLEKNRKLSSTDSLQQQIANLQIRLASQQEIEQENQALRDQFAPSLIPPTHLVPARIVGEPQFIPGVSVPQDIIIDKGSSDNIQVGMAVVYTDTLIGTIVKTTAHFSQVQLIMNNTVSFTGYTSQHTTLGIVKGRGLGQILFDTVLLSDPLYVGDIVVTSGSTTIDGHGIAPGLVVGRITSIEKKSSSLFQQANIQAMIDVTRLKMVFIMIQ